jgi:hypothetical protein
MTNRLSSATFPLATSRPVLLRMALIVIFAIQFQHAHAQGNLPNSNVSKETRAKLERVRLKYPEFKLYLPEMQECLDGKLIDPECDPAISGEIDLYEKKQNIAERERNIAERERNIAEMKRARNDCFIVIGSVQVGLLAFEDRAPSKEASFIELVIDDADTPIEVKRLFKDYLARKERREKFTKLDSERLMALANKHLDSARSLLLTQTNATFKQQISAFIFEASKSLGMAKQVLAKRTAQ